MDEANSVSLDATSTPDLERNDGSQFLMNHTVRDFSWSGLTVTVKDRQTKQSRDLINDISGDVHRGMYDLFESNKDGADM